MPVPGRDLHADAREAIARRMAGADMSAIHKWLTGLGYSPQEARLIMQGVDRAEARRHQQTDTDRRALFLMGGGSLMLLIGVLMTWASYVRALEAGGRHFVLTWGLMLFGLTGIISGLFLRRGQ